MRLDFSATWGKDYKRQIKTQRVFSRKTLSTLGVLPSTSCVAPFPNEWKEPAGNFGTEAYEYVVNGKPALDWVVERQRVKTDEDSGIVNDANDWAIETMNNPKYPLELFLRVVTVSLETMKIVKALPRLELLA